MIIDFVFLKLTQDATPELTSNNDDSTENDDGLNDTDDEEPEVKL
jgi:hypothetical protein